MRKHFVAALLLVCASGPLHGEDKSAFDAAAAFGARPSVFAMSLAPDGQTVAYLSPTGGQGSQLNTLSLAKGAKPVHALSADGKPLRLLSCSWVSNTRLVCQIYGLTSDPEFGIVGLSRMIAVDADGKNPRIISTQENRYSRGWLLGGDEIIDWLPDQEGSALMARAYLPDDRIGSRFGSSATGMGVDSIDTRTAEVKHLEPPNPKAVDYISDGRGVVRIMALKEIEGGYNDAGVTQYLYRLAGSHEWHALSNYNWVDRSGFNPYAVDPELNVAYGFKKQDARLALYSVRLDGSLQENLIYARPDVDVTRLIRLGRRQRVVGTSYVTDTRKSEYFAPDIAALVKSLANALHTPTLRIVDSNVDETKLLVFAGTDEDPGAYYIFDRKSHELATFLVARRELEGVKLATQKPITYPGPDGVAIPAYLTLPPGHETAKGLPAIVLPHGGPSARDEWGFDWLSQFYAARGYAVLQPNFRGSSGYGDAWFEQNGFKSWQIAIGDVLAAGRWLISEGIADPNKLAIVGWSYGGYAALQSAVVDPTVFKAVVAIAPVTDLNALKEEYRRWSNFQLVSDYVGSGRHTHEGSPLEQAEKIKVPVLLFHAAMDRNVGINQSRRMADRLTAAGAKCELITWDNLDHYLDDSAAREKMLRTSDEFIRHTTGM